MMMHMTRTMQVEHFSLILSLLYLYLCLLG